MMPIRIMLVDDHEIVRTGLRMMLEAEPDLEIVAEAESGEEALEKAVAIKPDIVIMDVSLPGMDGAITTRVLRERAPGISVLALTIHEDERYFFQMLTAGASGYLPKRAAPTDLVTAIRTVSQGNVYLYPSLATTLVGDYLQRAETGGDERQSFDELTPRQRQVLTLMAEGLSNAEIAERLDISTKTVARHRENMMARLNLHSRTELVKYAIRKGLIEV
jgi:two-component system response regulator NreC